MAREKICLHSAGEGWLPIDNPPVGLVSWYAPDGSVMAQATSWLGIIGGHPPELRAGCCGKAADLVRFPAGTDFTVNLPPRRGLAALSEPLARALPGCTLAIGTAAELRPARQVHAPLLAGCALHIECTAGRLLPHDREEELAGEIVLLHRDGLCLAPEDDDDFSLLQPFRRPALA
jgi:flavin reductase (DIM6/NTAB) family NADH-FMN oxidoreductase RutF